MSGSAEACDVRLAKVKTYHLVSQDTPEAEKKSGEETEIVWRDFQLPVDAGQTD